MKYTEQAVETLDDAGSVIANKNIEIEQLRQRVAELKNERDKATQYWQIAEGRVDNMYWLTIKLHILKLFDKIRGSE